jgi:signal transduction histidine kinase
MSAQVAHEIRNPLSAIGLNAELLEEEFAHHLPTSQGEEAVNLLRAIEHEIERLTQITEGYLRLTKNPKPEYQTCDLNRSVTSLLTMLRAELSSKAIDLELNLQSPPPLAWADPGQIRQALINTIRNAEEAMPQGGTITIQTESQPKICELKIHDTGTGIPKAVQPRIFEPFYTTKSNGTGLGLSLTKQIITEHGGSIAVEESTTEGTVLSIRIPTSSHPATGVGSPAS